MGKELPWRGKERSFQEEVAPEPSPEGEGASSAETRGRPCRRRAQQVHGPHVQNGAQESRELGEWVQ